MTLKRFLISAKIDIPVETAIMVYKVRYPPETNEKFIQTVLGIVGIIYLKCQPGKE